MPLSTDSALPAPGVHGAAPLPSPICGTTVMPRSGQRTAGAI